MRDLVFQVSAEEGGAATTAWNQAQIFPGP